MSHIYKKNFLSIWFTSNFLRWWQVPPKILPRCHALYKMAERFFLTKLILWVELLWWDIHFTNHLIIFPCKLLLNLWWDIHFTNHLIIFPYKLLLNHTNGSITWYCITKQYLRSVLRILPDVHIVYFCNNKHVIHVFSTIICKCYYYHGLVQTDPQYFP